MSDTRRLEHDRALRPGWQDALLFFAAFAALFFNLGSYGLYEPHEAHFAGVGREMLLRGDWVTPHLNGAPYLNKPPLLYWMIATSYAIFGIHEWAARLPLALIGLGGVVLAWQWARELWGLRAGRMAAGLLMSSTGWYLFSHQLMIDLLLTALYFATLYALWKALLEPDRTRRWVIVYLLLGLSVMAKGPIALIFYVVVFGFYTLAIQRDFGLLWRCRPLLGVAIVLALVLPWALMVERRVPGVLHYMIVNENLKRAIDQRWPPDYSVVKVSPLEFLVVALIWLAPWSLMIPPVVMLARERARGGGNMERIGAWILGLGALTPTVLFLPMSSRLIYYCLPTLPPFVMLAAAWWNNSHDERFKTSRVALGAIFSVIGAVIISAGIWVPGLLKEIPDLAAAPSTIANIPGMAYLLGTALLIGGILLLVRRTGWSALVFSVGIVFACVYNVKGFGDFDTVRSSRNLVRALNTSMGSDAIWISEGSKEIGASAGISYYLGTDAKGQARSVFVMEDDKRRPPPAFPPPKPGYLIDRKRLNELWASETPVLFVTDFQRMKWTPEEAPYLPDNAGEPFPVKNTGHRRVYGNEAARKRFKNP